MTKFDDIFENKYLTLISETAEKEGVESYVVGGYVRDHIMGRKNKDIDILTIGKDSSEILSKAVCKALGRRAHLSVFKTFGTAQVKIGDTELEFVTARKESYNRDSRNPECEPGTLDDDLLRRDFTVNAMCVRLSGGEKGVLIDKFNGEEDLENLILRTPCDPLTTFDDDPLRMMRCVRFSSTLGLYIEQNTYDAICQMASRLSIITKERIKEELVKIVASPRPSVGLYHMENSGLMKYAVPEIHALAGIESKNGVEHKDNFKHTMQVLDTVAKQSDNLWLRMAALFHDIAKPQCKKWEDGKGWTFYSHEFLGSKMITRLFRTLTLPLGTECAYVQKLILLHMRPISLIEDTISDSAIRRLLFEAGDDIDDLMILCNADITSNNVLRRDKYHKNYIRLKEKMKAIEERDHVRSFQPPVDGLEIMKVFGLSPCREVGLIKDEIKDSILDGKIGNNREEALSLMFRIAEKLGLQKVAEPNAVSEQENNNNNQSADNR